MFIPDLPVYSAKFILQGSQVILTGNRKHFYSYDMASNKLEKMTVGTVNQKNLSNIAVGGSDFMSISSGDSGMVHLFSQKLLNNKKKKNKSKSKLPLFSLKMNGSCSAACFNPKDEKYLYTAGD